MKPDDETTNQVDEAELDDLDESSFEDHDDDDLDQSLETETESWDEIEDDLPSPTPAELAEFPPPPKKGSSFLTYGVIGVLVAGAVLFGYTKFFSGAQERSTMVAPDDSLETADGTLPPGDPNSLSSLRDEPDAQYKPTPVESAPEQVSPPLAQGGFMNEPLPNQEPPQPTALPLPSPASAVPAGSSPLPPAAEGTPALSADTVLPTPPEAATPTESSGAAEATTGAEDLLPEIKATSDFPSVDAIKKAAPPQVPPQQTSDSASLPAPVAEGSADAGEIKELEGKLASTEERIKQLEAELKSAKEQVVKATEEADRAAAALAARPVVATPAAQEPKVAPEETEAPIETSAPQTGNSSAEVKTPTVPFSRYKWELRSARPGQAMIASRSGKEDVRTISVGDDVPGLGRITSISKTSTGWVVMGTQATVGQ